MSGTCLMPECGRLVENRGLCHRHRQWLFKGAGHPLRAEAEKYCAAPLHVGKARKYAAGIPAEPAGVVLVPESPPAAGRAATATPATRPARSVWNRRPRTEAPRPEPLERERRKNAALLKALVESRREVAELKVAMLAPAAEAGAEEEEAA